MSLIEGTTAPRAPESSKAKIFLRRLFSSLLLWTVLLTALFSTNRIISEVVFGVLIVFLATAGLFEFYGLVQRQGLACFKYWGLFGGILLMIGTFLNLTGRLGASGSPARVNDFETSFLILFVLGLCLRQFFSRSNTAGLLAISTTLLGLMYVPYLLNFVQKINFYPDVEGHYFLLYFVLITKFSDMGAYSVGSLIGRHKMIPRISPGKTWEGFGGAIIVSTLASMAFVKLFGSHMPRMNYVDAVILGVVLSISAVVGDLIESVFKREAGVKDSGKFFPGIGGMLDLLDSILFNAPLMYLYLRYILAG